MSIKTIASLTRPGIAYEVSTDSLAGFESRGEAMLYGSILEFNTYGDGTIKHSHSHATQFHNFVDCAYTLTRAILAEPTAPEWRRLTTALTRFRVEVLRLALTIKWDEKKERFFNLADCKIAAGEGKRHDRRWEEVKSWMSGGPANALKILLNSRTYSVDWLERLIIAHDLREISYELHGMFGNWEEIFPAVKDLPANWESALSALIYALKAVGSLDSAGHVIEAFEHNSKLAKEEAAA